MNKLRKLNNNNASASSKKTLKCPQKLHRLGLPLSLYYWCLLVFLVISTEGWKERAKTKNYLEKDC